MIGIDAILVNFLNLIPQIMGLMIDLIVKADTGAVSYGYLPFGLARLWPCMAFVLLETLYFRTANKLAQILRYHLFNNLRSYLRLLSEVIGQDLMACCIINTVTIFASSRGMSAVDTSVTRSDQVHIFHIDGAALPLLASTGISGSDFN